MTSCRRAALWLTLAFTTGAAWAQGYTTGSLGGRVTGGDGAPLAGVQVTVASPQLQGVRTQLTAAAGDYRFAWLPAGDATVTFTASGMQPLARAVRVAAAQSQQLDVALSAAAPPAAASTAGGGQTISASAQGAVTYQEPFLDRLPARRSVEGAAALAPGVARTFRSGLTISGAPSYENLYVIDGVVANENVRGQLLDLYIEDAVQETTVAASSLSAEYGRFTGGMVDVVTRSGGNHLAGSWRTTFDDQKWQSKTPLTTTQTDDVVPTHEATLGGAAMRDRLWFFLAGRSVERSETLTTMPPTSVPYDHELKQQRFEGKLTGALGASHSLVGTYHHVDDTEHGASFGTILDTASLTTRETKQEAWSLDYRGMLTPALQIAALYSRRDQTFTGGGGPRELIAGTLLLDRTTGLRYHAPTFCGECEPEQRDNRNLALKASWFLPTRALGSHEIVGGYDSFDDIRQADNHQSGSDYRVFSDTVVRGSDIFPVFRNDGTTVIQYNPILLASHGTDFYTRSAYVHDVWRLDQRFSFDLGLRYDRNDGTDSAGHKVADDSKVSPRLAATWDPRGDGDWLVHAGYGEYVAALANNVADATSTAGAPATLRWVYRGPAINTGVGPLLDQDQALRLLFDWFYDVNGGPGSSTNLTTLFVPGSGTQIRGSLQSPSVREYTLGTTKRLGRDGMLRADLVHRDWTDFYSSRIDLGTGPVTLANGAVTDLALLENDSHLYSRTYDGLHTAFEYRPAAWVELGGTYVLSRTHGNLEGEAFGSGPVPGALAQYPEYKRKSWNAPDGDLASDQRHRLDVFAVFRLLGDGRQQLHGSVLQAWGSGHPYGAVGIVNPASYVANPGYVRPPQFVDYYFTARDAYRTPSVYHTDLALDYEIALGPVALFVKPEVINVFDSQSVVDTSLVDTFVASAAVGGACGGSPTGRCLPFDPFTTTPQEGVNWQRGPTFGKAVSPLAYQQPRTYRFSIGLRF